MGLDEPDGGFVPFHGVTVMVDKQTMCLPMSKPFSIFSLEERVSRVVLMIFLLLVGLLCFSVVFALVQWKSVDGLTADLGQREKQLGEQRSRVSEVERDFRKLKSTSEDKISELQEEAKKKIGERNPLIKPGEKFGEFKGIAFDDSDTSNFTHGHYFSGLSIHHVNDDLESYEFHYTTDQKPKPIRSKFHGKEMTSMRSTFDCNHRDRVIQVEGFVTERNIRLANGTNSSVVAVTGLQFYPRNGIRSNYFEGIEDGRKFSENFSGYSLGYIKGRADSANYLYQIQFVWYRTEPID